MKSIITKIYNSKIFTIFAILSFIGIILSISFGFLLHNSIRLDESQSLWQTSRSIVNILKVIAQDVHIPLYHIILHTWQAYLGNDIAVARILSVVFFVVTIPIAYKLFSFAYNNKTIALFSTLLLSISPFLNWYANEVRMYSLLILLVVSNQYFFLRIYKNNDALAYLGFFITSLFGIYTHYFFSVYLIVIAIFFFIFRKEFQPRTLPKLLTIFVIVGSLFTPWLYFVYSQGSASNTKPLLTQPTTVDLFNTFDQYFVGFQEDATNSLIISLWPLITILILLLLRRRFKGFNLETYFFATVAFAPILLVFFFSLFVRPFFVSRYLAYTIPSLYILIGYVITLYSKRITYFLRIVLIFVMLSGFFLQLNTSSPVIENYKQAIDYTNANISYQDVLILSAPFTLYPVEYYYKADAPIYTLPIWERTSGQIPPFNKENLPLEIEQLTSKTNKAWVLLSYDQGYEEDIRLYFDEHFHRLEAHTFSKDLKLFVYQITY